MTKISDIVKQIIDIEKVTINKFSQKLGYDRSQTIHDIVNAKSNPSYDFFYKFVLSEFSEKYDLYWLITGDGSMFRSFDPLKANPESDQSEIIKMLREKIADQQEIIDLLKDKIELLQGGRAGDGDNMPAAAAG